MKKYIISLFAVSLALLTGCSDPEETEATGPVDTIEVNLEGMHEMTTGDTFQLKISTAPFDKAKLTFYYTSEGVIDIDDNYLVTAKGYGTCAITIVANSSDGKYVYKDVVFKVFSPVLSVEIKEGYEAVALNVGKTYDISSYFAVLPQGYVKYSLEPETASIATIDEKGVITGVAVGTTKINIKDLSGLGENASIDVNVTADGGFNMNPLVKTGWTASASTVYSSTYAAAKAVDSSNYSHWRGALSAPSPQWLLIDMGSLTQFDRIDILRYSNYAKDVEIWVSATDSADLAHDDASFKKIGELLYDSTATSTSVSDATLKTRSYYPNAHNVRYVKLMVTSSHANYCGIAEVSIYRRK